MLSVCTPEAVANGRDILKLVTPFILTRSVPRIGLTDRFPSRYELIMAP